MEIHSTNKTNSTGNASKCIWLDKDENIIQVSPQVALSQLIITPEIKNEVIQVLEPSIKPERLTQVLLRGSTML